MTSTQIKTDLDALRDKIASDVARIAELEREHRRALSREWIAQNGVTRDDVQLSGGEGMPYFGHVEGFARWMLHRTNRKTFAEWNQTIYRTADLIAGKMPRDAPGLLSDVPA